jgi:GT2 family glycosyltransferase
MAAVASRPRIDVVVPFHGTDAGLRRLLDRLAGLPAAAGDTVTVVDNRATATGARRAGAVELVAAPAEQSSYHARNVGARAGANPWLLFIDSDVLPPPDLLDRYFDEPLGDDVGVVAGAIRDQPVAAGDGIAARYAYLEQTLAHENVLAGRHPFAATANALVRREAFERVGGFAEGIRSGGDADLCFRIVDAGWTLTTRPATVQHEGRPSVARLLRQYVRYGAGAAWLDERHPGFLEVRPWRNLVLGAMRGGARAAIHAARGEPDAAIVAGLRPLTRAAFRLGSYLPNAAVPASALLRRALTRRAG